MNNFCEKTTGCTSWCSSRVQKRVSQAFAWVGYNSYIHPCKFILAGVLLTALSSIGLINIALENEGVRLWVPVDSEIISQYDDVIDNFGEFETSVNLLVGNKENTDNLLTTDNLDGLYDVFYYVFNNITAEDGGTIWKYEDFCVRDYPSYPICQALETNVFALYNNDATNWETQTEIENGMKTAYGQVLGEVKRALDIIMYSAIMDIIFCLFFFFFFGFFVCESNV